MTGGDLEKQSPTIASVIAGYFEMSRGRRGQAILELQKKAKSAVVFILGMLWLPITPHRTKLVTFVSTECNSRGFYWRFMNASKSRRGGF